MGEIQNGRDDTSHGICAACLLTTFGIDVTAEAPAARREVRDDERPDPWHEDTLL